MNKLTSEQQKILEEYKITHSGTINGMWKDEIKEVMDRNNYTLDEALLELFYIEGVSIKKEPDIVFKYINSREEYEEKIKEIVEKRGWTREKARDFLIWKELMEEWEYEDEE